MKLASGRVVSKGLPRARDHGMAENGEQSGCSEHRGPARGLGEQRGSRAKGQSRFPRGLTLLPISPWGRGGLGGLKVKVTCTRSQLVGVGGALEAREGVQQGDVTDLQASGVELQEQVVSRACRQEKQGLGLGRGKLQL